MRDEGQSHRGKGPKNYQRSEERIREDVCDRLSDDHSVDASDIDIKVSGSEVILSGTVESREAKRRAEDIVESISGVTNVQNQLRVGNSGSLSSSMGSSQSKSTSIGSTTGTTGTTNR
jgi:osmotically-inducible protein OsmY